MPAFRVLIPARYGSSRLPAKPLRLIAGKPMIQHVYERALESGAASVVVATDDERIRAAVEGFGGRVCMTSPEHPSGSDRLAEATTLLAYGEDEIVVNLQGDEPLMPPRLLTQVAANLRAQPAAQVATLCVPITTAEELADPNVVKVVSDRRGLALYFSRAPIPWVRDAFGAGTTPPQPGLHFRHIGLYAYRVGFLREYVRLAPAPQESAESLEQLRVLWHGAGIHVAEAAEPPGHGVDTEEDLQRAAAILERRS